VTQVFLKIKQNRFFWAAVISLALHLLLFLILIKDEGLTFFQSGTKPENMPKKPIVFEIVETPDHARVEEPQEKATLFSDKNAIAKDNVKIDLPEAPVPFSKGISEIKEIPQQRGGQPQRSPSMPQRAVQQQNQEQEQESAPGPGQKSVKRIRSSASSFSREMLIGRSGQTSNASMNQQKASTQNAGGMSFNTYNWDFAPYMIKLKKLIQKNIFPPSVFTRLGFGGKNLIKFKIYPDGRLEGPVTLSFQGEKALVQTSTKAVELSAPFPALPKTFPEPFLEVTAQFQYFIN